MNQLMERMCSISNCCVSSRDTRERSEQSPLFERRLRDQNRRGVDATRNGDIDGRGLIYADYDFDPSTQSQESTPQKNSADGSSLFVTAMFPFEGNDPQPFPPDPYPDLSVQPGDKLKVFPSMTQYGWCFVVDLKDDTRRGWVPGNYVTSNGRDPYLSAGGQLEERLWNEVAEENNLGESQENPLVGPADPL